MRYFILLKKIGLFTISYFIFNSLSILQSDFFQHFPFIIHQPLAKATVLEDGKNQSILQILEKDLTFETNNQELESLDGVSDHMWFKFTLMRFKSNIVVDKAQVEPAKVTVDFKSDYAQVTLNLSSEAAKNPSVAIPEIAMMAMIKLMVYFYLPVSESPANIVISLRHHVRNNPLLTMVDISNKIFSFSELLFNAQQGSLVAQARLEEFKLNLISNIQFNGPLEDLQKSVEMTRRHLSDNLNRLLLQAQKQQRTKNRELIEWRKKTGLLEKYESMDQKLNDLILANDRKGVREMLEAYLPWVVMEPFETQAWKTWLNAIEKPNWNDTIVAWRGLDYQTDKIQRSEDGHRIGFFSTMLSANQGSYTRRLRSLTTNRIANGDILYRESLESFQPFGGVKSLKLVPSKISDQFIHHAGNPHASSFLSLTYNPSLARNFSRSFETTVINGKKREKILGGIVAVNIDRKRVVSNITSAYPEVEILVPLIIFPDEVISFREGRDSINEGLNSMVEEVKLKTGKDFSQQWQSILDQNSVPLAEKYRQDGWDFFKSVTEKAKIASTKKRCQYLFQQ